LHIVKIFSDTFLRWISFLTDIWDDIRAFWVPRHCPVCGQLLGKGVPIVCMRCRIDAPLTKFWLRDENPLSARLRGFMPIEQASALLFFRHGSGWREMIHSFKYRGAWLLALECGHWLGEVLATQTDGRYAVFDVVVPVPLHPFKQLRRGYNQVDYLAEGVAKELGIPVDRRSVVRRVNNKSQAGMSRQERCGNVAGIFKVRRPKRLAGRTILLVDDVLTTGETVLSCAETIMKSVPNCRIGVVALAASAREFDIYD